MTIATQTLVIGFVSFAAGVLGALTGLGGGVVVVPFLTLGLGVDIRYAIGASLVSVIATSSGAAASFVREGYTNLRLAMFLELATTSGALIGAGTAAYLNARAIAFCFGGVLLYSAYSAIQRHFPDGPGDRPDPLARRLRLDGAYPDSTGPKPYCVRRVPVGFLLMVVAGMVSGLLGIGSGALKVLAMDRIMRVPYKVSSATSNFMIGVTAAASAGLYLARGYIDPGLVMPVVLGVLIGALVGARLLLSARTQVLRVVFAVAVAALGIEMIRAGWTGRIG